MPSAALFTGVLSAANTANFTRNALGGEKIQKAALVYAKIACYNALGSVDYRTDNATLITLAEAGFAGRTAASIEASRINTWASTVVPVDPISANAALTKTKNLRNLSDLQLLKLEAYLDALIMVSAGPGLAP